MNKHNNPLSSKVYNMAANLFGTMPKDQEQEIIHTESQPADPNRIMAVYPAIIHEAFAMTMDNYRQYVAAYNLKTRAENDQLAKYNNIVEIHRKTAQLTESESNLLRTFHKQYKSVGDRIWNEKAEDFNNNCGMLVHKRKVQTIKPTMELTFQNLVFAYNKQLMKRNEEYMRLRVTGVRPLQEFKINPYRIKEQKRNKIASLDVCTKTIRNHRERFEEAGVLLDYKFLSSWRPVEAQINPQILTVFDLKTSKIVTAENQRVSPNIVKELPHSFYVNTRTIINECEMKANVENNSPDKEFPAVTPSDLFFTKNTSSKQQNPFVPAAPPDVKVSENLPEISSPAGRFAKPAPVSKVIGKITQPYIAQSQTSVPAAPKTRSESDNLAALIIDPQRLAEELREGFHDRYAPIDIRILFREAFRGTMTKADFRELVIQDFFKNSAKLFVNNPPWAGAWKNAINLYYDNKFIGFNNNIFNKSVIIDDISELRWRLENVRKYQVKNPEWNILFPSHYFDFRRTDKGTGGFEYTKKAWEKHRKYLIDKVAKEKRAEAQSELRMKTINYSKKCENEIRRFFKHQITLPQLIAYVENNLPPQFMDKLPKMIEKISMNFKIK